MEEEWRHFIPILCQCERVGRREIIQALLVEVLDYIEEHERRRNAGQQHGPDDGGVHLGREQSLSESKGGNDEGELATTRHGKRSNDTVAQEWIVTGALLDVFELRDV